jgi:hypothetical protein
MTPDEFVQVIRAVAGVETGEIAAAMEALTEIYSQFLYGPEVATPDDVARACKAFSILKQAVARRGRKFRRAVPSVGTAG